MFYQLIMVQNLLGTLSITCTSITLSLFIWVVASIILDTSRVGESFDWYRNKSLQFSRNALGHHWYVFIMLSLTAVVFSGKLGFWSSFHPHWRDLKS